MERNPKPNDVIKEDYVNPKDKFFEKNKIHQSSAFTAKQATTRQVIVKRLKMSLTKSKHYLGKNLFY